MIRWLPRVNNVLTTCLSRANRIAFSDELDRLERNETEIFEMRILANKFTVFLNNSILNSFNLFFNSKVRFLGMKLLNQAKNKLITACT